MLAPSANTQRVPEAAPLRVMFVVTSMPVGGAETLLLNLMRRMDRARFQPELCCLKSLEALGRVAADEFPAFERLLRHKYDAAVWWRLHRLLRRRRVDALVTVGAGDKMFWGRLAAASARVPVVLSALHTIDWVDPFPRLSRLLDRRTDGFVAVAGTHGDYLRRVRGFPASKVFVIRNGVDVERFRPRQASDARRAELGLPAGAPVVGIVAALRPEKHHELFLDAAARVRRDIPAARFLIIGDGHERARLEAYAAELGLADAALFLGSRPDVERLLALVDVVALSSRSEASPVSILEALASGKPVVAPALGSIAESIADGQTGYLVEPHQAAPLAARIVELLRDPDRAQAMGRAGRERIVADWSLDSMVAGYQDLITRLYAAKRGARPLGARADDAAVSAAAASTLEPAPSYVESAP